MASKTQIVNIALQRIGVSQAVANVDTEQSRAAVSAKTLFDDERDYCLREFPWAFATSYVTLGLVAGTLSVPVNNDWIFAYRYPSDALTIRRIVTTLGRKLLTPAPFRVGQDADGRLIYTDQQFATVEVTARVTEPSRFDPVFVSMLAWKLGSTLALSLGRTPEIAASCMQMFELDRVKAQSRDLREGQHDQPADAEWIRDRG